MTVEHYTPQPGTIPYRAVSALKAIPPGAELSSAALLEAIGQPADFGGLHKAMELAVLSGLVKKRTDERLSFWSLGAGQPVEAKPKAVKTTIQQTNAATQSGEPAFGLFSDGRLVIEPGDGAPITLPRATTEKLVAFLDRLGPGGQ